jgi:transposase
LIALASGVRVYLACGVTDMRRGMVGLAMLVQQGLGADHLMVRSTPSVAAAPG